MYDDTVTLFNFYHSSLSDMWYPSVLHSVHLNMDKATLAAKYGPESTDNASLHVKYQVRGGRKVIGNKIWLPPKEWDAQINDLLPGSLTFTDAPTNTGDAPDFFWFGEWPDEEPITDDDTAWGRSGFYDYMNRKYDYVFTITSVGGPYSVIPHFEILAK